MSNLGHETADDRPGTGNYTMYGAGLLLVVVILLGLLMFGVAERGAEDAANVDAEVPAATATEEAPTGN